MNALQARSSTALAAALVLIVALALTPGRAQHEDEKTKTATEAAIEEIFQALLRGGGAPARKYREKLQELGRQDLSPLDREEWLALARDAAVRLGDRAWLESLKRIPSTFSDETTYTVLLAYGKLKQADLAGSEAALSQLAGAEKRGEINVRDARRMTALRARIAQLRGDDKQERAQIEALIAHLPHWPEPECQRCRNTATSPKEITSMPVTNLWFGERFVEILRRDGDADAVKRASEAKLQVDAQDNRSRIRLGFALLALGQNEAAEKTFRALPWAEFPGRELKKPRMMTTFP